MSTTESRFISWILFGGLLCFSMAYFNVNNDNEVLKHELKLSDSLVDVKQESLTLYFQIALKTDSICSSFKSSREAKLQCKSLNNLLKKLN